MYGVRMLRSAVSRSWRARIATVLAVALIAGVHAIPIPAAEAQTVPELCESVPVGRQSPFTDVVDGLYGAEYIACMKHLGLTSGKSDGSFGRVDELTRAQMGSFLARFWRLVSGRQCPSGDLPFEDVDRGGAHYEGISCIYQLGITSGKTATLYDPGSSVTAGQLSLFLWRTYKNLGGSSAGCRYGGDQFDEAVSCLRSIDVIPSEAEGRLDQPVIRGQVAVYVVGTWLHLGGRSVPAPPHRPGQDSPGSSLSYEYPNEPADDRSPAWSPDGTMLAFGEGWFGNDGLYVVTADGADRRRLADQGRDPAWSPDGTELAFVGADGLYVIGVDGEKMRRLDSIGGDTSQAQGHYQATLPHSPVWSPDGRRVAFVGWDGLYVIRAGGGGLRQIRNHPGVLNPMWSRDSNRIFFTQAADIRTHDHTGPKERRHLWVVDADGTNPQQLTRGDGIDPTRDTSLTRYNSFALSPNDKHVAFTTRAGVYVMDSDGSDRRRITGSGGNYITPAWSPDGQYIAVATYHDLNYDYDILVMSPDGRSVKQLTSYDGDEYYPSWSPEGGRIAYLANPIASGSESSNQLFIVDVAAVSAFSPSLPVVPKARKLTSNSVDDWSPVWSPDGNKIAFVSDDGGDSDSEIYVMDTDGSNRRKLTNNRVHDFDPVWSPDSRYIFFTREQTAYKDYELYRIDTLSGTERRVPFGQNRVHRLEWSLSPDGRKISYTARGSTDQDWDHLFVMDADGSGTRRLISKYGDDYPYTANYISPVWSPDSKKIAFIIDNHHSAQWRDIHVINADGTGRRLVAETGHNLQVTWSSSDRLAFVRDEKILIRSKDGEREDYRSVRSVYSIWPDGSNIQHLIGSPSWEFDAVGQRFGHHSCDYYDFKYCRPSFRDYSSLNWSPDGSRIAFLESVGYATNARGTSVRHAFVMNTDGSGLQQLTLTFQYDSDLFWAPDGRRILFVSGRANTTEGPGDLEIYVVDVP